MSEITLNKTSNSGKTTEPYDPEMATKIILMTPQQLANYIRVSERKWMRRITSTPELREKYRV